VTSVDSQAEKLPQNLHGIFGPVDCVTNRSRIIVDLVVIAAFEALVPKEMDVLVLDAGQSLRSVCFCLDMLQTVRLIPTVRENVKGNLSANRVSENVSRAVATKNSRTSSRNYCWYGQGWRGLRKAEIRELFLECLYHLLPTASLLVPSLEFVPLFVAGISSHWTDIDHARPKLDEGTAHSGKAFQLRDVLQAEFGQSLVPLLAKLLEERKGWQRLTQAISCETVLGKAEIKH
jgi:hypothetical protein